MMITDMDLIMTSFVVVIAFQFLIFWIVMDNRSKLKEIPKK